MGDHVQFSNVQTGTLAARHALADANLLPEDIGMVIAGGSLPQYSLPAEACMIAGALGINQLAFDINSACSTLAIQMHLLNQMPVESLPDYILIVIPENMTRAINFKDRKVAVLWGDGAAALVVSKRIQSKLFISHTTASSCPSAWNTIRLPAGGHFHQEGSAVQKFAIKKTLETLGELRQRCSTQVENTYFIGHQANLTMLRSICRLANIPEQRHLYNVDQFGNCGAAGAPSVLSQYRSRLVAGDTVLLVVVGAGLTWGGMIIEMV